MPKVTISAAVMEKLEADAARRGGRLRLDRCKKFRNGSCEVEVSQATLDKILATKMPGETLSDAMLRQLSPKH